VLDLNRALEELGELDASKVQMVELRYFLGCTSEETADLMQVSKATVDREMKFIKTWLFRRMRPVRPRMQPDVSFQGRRWPRRGARQTLPTTAQTPVSDEGAARRCGSLASVYAVSCGHYKLRTELPLR
jgi:hypothetical protein